MKILTTGILYFFIPAMLIAAPIKNFNAKYDVYHNEFYVGETSRTLNFKNNYFRFSSVTKTAGLAALFSDITINETSQLVLDNNHLNFFSYHFDEMKDDKNSRYQLSIDEESRQLYNSHTQKYYPVTKNLYDMLGFTIAIMHDLKNGQRLLKYTLASKDKIKSYQLKFIQEEKLVSDNEEIITLKMEHYDPQKKQRFTFWCAKNLDFLPIKVQKIKSNGDEILLNLTMLNQRKFDLPLNDEEFD